MFRKFAQKIPRKFGVRYNPYTQRIEVIERKEQILNVLKQVKSTKLFAHSIFTDIKKNLATLL